MDVKSRIRIDSDSGGSTLKEEAPLHPQFLALHPQFGTMQQKLSP